MEASPTQESDLFKGVSNRVIGEIGRGAVELVFEPDTLICKTDDEASTIYELVEGTVDIMVLEKEHVHYTVMRPGEISVGRHWLNPTYILRRHGLPH